jgi:glucokinase
MVTSLPRQGTRDSLVAWFRQAKTPEAKGRVSQTMGEFAARSALEARGYKILYEGGGRGHFDFVAQKNGLLFVVEAKGGTAGLGSFTDRQGRQWAQLTPEHTLYTIENMSNTPGLNPLAAQIFQAYRAGQLRGIRIRTPWKKSKGQVVGVGDSGFRFTERYRPQ